MELRNVYDLLEQLIKDYLDHQQVHVYYVDAEHRDIIKKAVKYITSDGIKFDAMCNVLDNNNFKIALQVIELKRLNMHSEDL